MSTDTPLPVLPLAVPDDQVHLRIGCPQPHNTTRDRWRREGRWPDCFYVGGRALVLIADIDRFVAQRIKAAPADRAPMQRRAKRALEVKAERKRAREAAASAASNASGDAKVSP